jgi:GH15 family glucan-1,4-alpha-glucosidase
MQSSSTAESLLRSSIDVILGGQAPSGAYVASPSFPSYHFGWLRDGSYCALAMDAAGEHASARAFHQWVAGVVNRETGTIDGIVARLDAGEPIEHIHMLPTRYTLDGNVEGEQDEIWPNFQLDGYGTWLFAVERHFADALPAELRDAVDAVARYLAASWWMPCYDYWEEFGDRRHTSTLAAIAAGLGAASRMRGNDDYGLLSRRIVDEMLGSADSETGFAKGPEDKRVDASLLSLSTPFDLIGAADPRMRATVKRIAVDLSSPSGGIRRYLGDTFYGGNPWLMLTAWYGWHRLRSGDLAEARAAASWVERRASPDWMLAEQVLDEPQEPEFVAYWTSKWGPVADPLLWSHAKYILFMTDFAAKGLS